MYKLNPLCKKLSSGNYKLVIKSDLSIAKCWTRQNIIITGMLGMLQ